MGLNTHNRTTNDSDDELLRQLSSDLERLLPANVQNDYDLLILAMRRLPRGLHAMAAIHRLDLSMALDDLGWHFYNFYHWDFANETQWGLRELEAGEVAEIFESVERREGGEDRFLIPLAATGRMPATSLSNDTRRGSA